MNPKAPLETIVSCDIHEALQHAVDQGWVGFDEVLQVTGENLNNRDEPINTVYIIHKSGNLDNKKNVPIVKKKVPKKATINERTTRTKK